MPLVTTWCDGSAAGVFQFSESEDQALFGPPRPASSFHHIAANVNAETQAPVEARLRKADLREPRFYVLEHGYCRCIYATDPNGMIIELTVDNPEAAAGNELRRAKAHVDLQRWLAGDHRSNNIFRAATHQLA